MHYTKWQSYTKCAICQTIRRSKKKNYALFVTLPALRGADCKNHTLSPTGKAKMKEKYIKILKNIKTVGYLTPQQPVSESWNEYKSVSLIKKMPSRNDSKNCAKKQAKNYLRLFSNFIRPFLNFAPRNLKKVSVFFQEGENTGFL